MVDRFLPISLPPFDPLHWHNSWINFQRHVTLDTVPNNLDLMAGGGKLADKAVNLAGQADLVQFFPAP